MRRIYVGGHPPVEHGPPRHRTPAPVAAPPVAPPVAPPAVVVAVAMVEESEALPHPLPLQGQLPTQLRGRRCCGDSQAHHQQERRHPHPLPMLEQHAGELQQPKIALQKVLVGLLVLAVRDDF